MTTQLTRHFTLEEFTLTQHRGIDNTPTPAIIVKLKQTAVVMEAIRGRIFAPIIISSGYRCPELNAAVGGSAGSQHMTGEACDFIAPRFGSPENVMNAIVDSDIDYDQLILEFNRWVHVSWRAQNRRHHALRIDKAGTRPFLA
jgi:zinc D-Ala-D-Ala carboxypeptidase